MDAEFFGKLSGVLVFISIFPYAIQTYRRKIFPNPTTWALWTLIGGALLLTYRSSGAGANVWPAIFGFTNPLLITLLLLRDKWKPLDRVEKTCLVIGLVSLAVWFPVRESRGYAQYALYIAILADLCAAIPQIKTVWRDPFADRPFAWGMFAVGYGLAIFAVTEATVANYILPAYMFAGGLSICLPLVAHRLKAGVPLREWA